MALDLVIRGGTVVTPQGVGPWDVGVQGERIAVLALPGTLPTEGARVFDASGRVVAPGGVEPHTHLAHAIRTRPDDPGLTLGPEEDTRGDPRAPGLRVTCRRRVPEYIRPDRA